MSIHIREATVLDAEPLQAYATRLFAERLPGIFDRPVPTLAEELAFIEARVVPDNSTLLVAEHHGEIVGLLDFVGGTLGEERHAGTFGLSVDIDHRGTGIGTALIERLLEWAPQHGVWRIQVYAWENNPRAIALYERLGFEPEGVLRDAIARGGETIDVVVLARVRRDQA